MATLDLSSLNRTLEGLGLGTIPQFPEAHVLSKPLDIGRSYLAEIFNSLTDCGSVTAYNCIHWPNDVFTADLTVPLPQLKHGADSDTLAVDLMKRFPQSPLFMLPLHDGVHLRIMFRSKTLPRLLLPYILERKDSYGKDLSLGLRDPSSPDSGRKKVVIDFSSPNIASEFYGKHLRSTLLGAYITNQYESMGWEVVRLNYLGDWGKQIGLLGAGWEKFGSEAEFEADPVGHMLKVYNQINELFQPEVAASRAARDSGGDTAEIENHGLFAERNAFFKKMEEGDEKALALWKRFREAAVANYKKFYSRMNVKFDEYAGEAGVSTETMDEVEEILRSKEITEESEGSLIVDLKKHKEKSGRVIIRDRNGSRTYSLRELAAALDRERKYSFDKMIYVVANDHDMHFSRTIKILKLMDKADLADKLQHIPFNKGAEKQGHGLVLDELLDESRKTVEESLKIDSDKSAQLGEATETAAVLGISAIVAQELSAKRAADHPLDITKAAAFGIGTGPELQYWYSKVSSISKSAEFDLGMLSENDKLIEDESFFELLRMLAQYPNISSSAYQSLEPSAIMSYLTTIMEQLPICLEADDPITPAKAAVCEAVRQVLENGMKLLGMVPVSV